MNNDSTIVRQLQSGNKQAFNYIYRCYYKRLCAFALQYIPFSECEEVVQDVMAWLWENRMVITPDTTLKSFLFTCVKHKCINKNTHHLIKSNVLKKIHEEHAYLFDDPNYYEERELIELLKKTLDKLPKEYREAFTLNRFENLTYKEIAEITGVSSKTVAYRISQTLKILRVELKDYLPLLIFLKII